MSRTAAPALAAARALPSEAVCELAIFCATVGVSAAQAGLEAEERKLAQERDSFACLPLFTAESRLLAFRIPPVENLLFARASAFGGDCWRTGALC
jgi:hypothetical protein